ncbi:ADP-ribosylglycohydrolase family protein [Streptomyces sp. NPDC020192]|uniref:ADP-ribosylglycohydrolase family protein n=1 Tax=Streptomyces sp. NPDC020192 TaxID=3365066 RepID=UPI00378B21EC
MLRCQAGDADGWEEQARTRCGSYVTDRPCGTARRSPRPMWRRAIDGQVSHEGEGIYGGQAVAAGVAAVMARAAVAVVIASALAVIPDDSCTARSLRRGPLRGGHRRLPPNRPGPEAVALAFGAYAAADGDFREAVLTAVDMGRDADTTAAPAGALSGAPQGISAIPPSWSSAIGPARRTDQPHP